MKGDSHQIQSHQLERAFVVLDERRDRCSVIEMMAGKKLKVDFKEDVKFANFFNYLLILRWLR